MKKIPLLIILFLVFNSVYAQNADRLFKSFSEQNQAVKMEVSDGTYLVTFLDDEIVETAFIPNGEMLDPKSHAVIMKKEDVDVKDLLETGRLIVERSALKELLDRHQSDLVTSVFVANSSLPKAPESGRVLVE